MDLDDTPIMWSEGRSGCLFICSLPCWGSPRHYLNSKGDTVKELEGAATALRSSDEQS